MAVQTPMQRQYFEIKETCPENALLFFRLGDFYELFYEDAKKAAGELGLTLTARHKKTDDPMPMCGVPYHAAEKYISKLTQKGFSVAICDQVSDASLPGIVKREIVQIITPGTTLSDDVLDKSTNNYLTALYTHDQNYALASCDMSTGEFKVISFENKQQLDDELYRLQPAEILLNGDLFFEEEWGIKYQKDFKSINKQSYIKKADEFLKNHFNIQSLSSFGIDKQQALIEVSAMVIAYLKETQKKQLDHIHSISVYQADNIMYLDPNTIRNLEIFYTQQEGDRKGSLLHAIDTTLTAAGSRKLRKWLLSPLVDTKKIQERLDTVSAFLGKEGCLEQLHILKSVLDIERIIAKISCNRANPRDLLALKQSLSVLPELVTILESFTLPNIVIIYKTLNEKKVHELFEYLQKSIQEDAPISLSDGNIICEGFSEELDTIRKISQGGKEWLRNFEEKERAESGINNLKVGYNKVFGYYIEISKVQAQKAPNHYIRKQTLTNAERFITQPLKEYETKLLEAEETLLSTETKLFQEVCSHVLEHVILLQDIAQKIATIDIYASFSTTALQNNYTQPEICESTDIYIKNGRHPVIEQVLPKEQRFVPNDCNLEQKEANFALITGPNMGGKSTYLRQNMLITLMAQIGSFVPAEYAKIGVVDRLFTRIGASDNLSKGQSTFMVEMQETAYILHHATERSLIVLDEIGRGTATYDGLALAWAIFEHIHDTIRAKTLFATHYHELIDLADKKEHAKNLSVSVEEKNDTIRFLYAINESGANRSYGVEVAKLAGMPKEIVSSAQGILETLERDRKESDEHLMESKERGMGYEVCGNGSSGQATLPLSLGYEKHPVLDELEQLEINNMTPMEALKIIDELKNKLKAKL